jgi:hypothetical protein
MRGKLLALAFLLSAFCLEAQQLLLLDRFNGNKVVNDSTITVYSSDFNTQELTQYFTMKNNTDRPLSVYLRKTVNLMNDSTTDYFCFYIKCWPDTDTTDIADTIQPGAEDYTFASHVCHVRRFQNLLLPPGRSSITYTIFDNTTFPEPVEASVTVIYELSGLGLEEQGQKAATVYPNPASDWITVKAIESMPGNYTLMLFNSLGSLVRNTSIHILENELKFSVSNLFPGFYYGKLVSGHGAEYSFRFQVI